MDKSIQDNSVIKKYGVYLYLHDLYNNGLSLMPITVTETTVAGIRTTTGSMSKFNIRRSEFETLCNNQIIQFVEIAPKAVRKEMSALFSEKPVDIPSPPNV